MADKRRSRCQSAGRFEPVHGRHPYFHEYYVRTGVDDDVYSLGPVGRLADYKKIVGRIHQNT